MSAELQSVSPNSSFTSFRRILNEHSLRNTVYITTAIIWYNNNNNNAYW